MKTESQKPAAKKPLSLTVPKPRSSSPQVSDLSRLLYKFDPLSPNQDPQDPDCIFEQYGYDKVGNMTAFKDNDDNAMAYAFDALNRMESITYPTSPSVSYTYDDLSRRITMNDGTGLTEWQYADVLGLDVTVVKPQGTVKIEHNPLGQRTRFAYPPDPNNPAGPMAELTYAYDDAARLSTLVLEGATPQTLVTMTYDDANRPLTRTLGNGVQTQYGYDSPGNPAASMNRIAKITHFKSDLSTKLFELDYTAFDDNGNRTELVRTVFPFVDGRFGTGSKVNWEYDLTSQLNFERYKLANDTEFLTQEYINDNGGNRETHNINYFDQSRSIIGTYNAGNELTGLEIYYPSASSTMVEFEHNKRGGRTQMTMNPSDPNPTVVNYGYNEDNSLTEYGVVAPGRELEVEFTYSGGLRVEKVATGYLLSGGQQQYYSVHKKYLLDGVDVLLELQVISSTEYVTVLHIPGVLSATLMDGGTSVVRYQLHDAQGNVIGLVDTDQEVGPVYLQDSWGIPLVDSDCQTVNLASSPVQVESVPNPYRWGGAHGYYADEDVGMYLMGFRWYDSFTGRFISRDPIGFNAGDMNLYRPMGNNLVNEVDPFGLQKRRWSFYKWLYTGNGYASDETYQAALEAGADYVFQEGGLRGFGSGVSFDITPKVMGFSGRGSVGGNWTIDKGAGANASLGARYQEPVSEQSVTVSPFGVSVSEQEGTKPKSGVTLAHEDVRASKGTSEGAESSSGSTIYLGVGKKVGPVRVHTGIIADPQKSVTNWSDTLTILRAKFFGGPEWKGSEKIK